MKKISKRLYCRNIKEKKHSDDLKDFKNQKNQKIKDL